MPNYLRALSLKLSVKLSMLLFLAISAFSLPAMAQQEDVTFFVIGKHASYEQRSGMPLPVDFSFFAEIFLRQGGDASEAWLTLPTGERIAFEDHRQAEGDKRDNIFYLAGKRRYPDFAELQADYPGGEYRIDFETPGGPVHARLNFTRDELPAAPTIILSQAGRQVCTAVDPAEDLRVRWSDFASGGPDPNGLLDDLVFVILADEQGMRIVHSGRPFENKPFLTYAAEEFDIPAAAMRPGRSYALSVEHAILDDTRTYAGITAMTTRAATTNMSIATLASGDHDALDCSPAVRGKPSAKAHTRD